MCPRDFRLSGLRLKRVHVCHDCLDHFVNNANYASLCGNCGHFFNVQEEITCKRQNKQLPVQQIYFASYYTNRYRHQKWTLKNQWANTFSNTHNLFLFLSIRAFFCICCVINTFFKCFERLFFGLSSWWWFLLFECW